MSAATVKLPRRDEPLPGLPSLRDYDISKAIRACAEGRKLDGLEGEVHAELAKLARRPAGNFATGRSAAGAAFYMPITAPLGDVQRRDLTTSTGSGALASPTDIRPARFIDALRAKSLVQLFGAQVFSDMEGSTTYVPRKSSVSTFTWVSEGNAGTESTPNIDRVAFVPHHATGFVDISRTLLKSSSGTQQIVVGDLTTGLAAELDRVSLSGSGTSNEPLGLANNTDVPTVSLGANGAALTFANIVAIEKLLADSNADVATGRLGWITTPAARQSLRLTEKSSGSGQYVWGDDNRMLGQPAEATAHLPSNGTKGTGTNLSALVYGNFQDLVLGTWGGVDILVDPVTLGASGGLRIVAFLDCDVQPRHAESFVRVLDVVTA